MKKLLNSTKPIISFTLFILCFHFSFSQEIKNNACKVTPFKAYIDDADDYSNIRATPSGEIVLKLNNKYSYGYILNIIGFENGWFKTNLINGIDGYEISNFEGWIHNSIVGASVTHDLDIMNKPNGKQKLGKIIGEQDTFKIRDIHCEWIKIECKHVIGWVESKKICGNPVTTCP